MEEEKKDVKKVQGAKIKKKSEFQKIIEAFVPESKADVKGEVLKSVVVPTLKKMLGDMVNEGLDMWLYGSGGSGRRRSSGENSRINYSRISTDDYKPLGSSKKTESEGPSRDFGYAWFPTRGKAEIAFNDLSAAAENSKYISVADLYSVAGIESDNYQINKYGWESSDFLSQAKVAHSLDGGFYIKLPRPYKI